jgi:hypothetical protein
MRTVYKNSAFILLFLSLSLMSICNGIAQELNMPFADNADDSFNGQNNTISNSANQTASSSNFTSPNLDIQSTLDDARVGTSEDDFNPEFGTKDIMGAIGADKLEELGK